MASFNPQVQSTNTPGFVSDISQQPKSAQYNPAADESTSDIIMKNLTNVIPPLAEGGDRLTKLAIDNSIYDSNDKLNREFGATDTIALNNAKVPDIPASLQTSADNLQRVNQAYQSGAISKTTFDVKVASMASDLRAQYASPYLRDYIDKKVQDVTGVDPQNQVRKDIFAAVQKNQESALETEKKKIGLATDLAKNGVSVPNWQNMSLPQFIDATAVSQKYLDDHKRFEAASSDAKTAQSLTDDDHVRAAQQGVTGVVFQNFNNIHNNLGTTKAQIDMSIKNMSTMTGDQKNKLVAVTNQWADQTYATAKSWVIQHYTGGNLDQAKLDQILTPVKGFLDNYRTAVTSGDEQALKDLQDRSSAMKTRDDIQFMSVDHVRAAGAANRVLGNIAGAAAMEPWLPQITKDADRTFVRDQFNQNYGTDNGISASTAYRNLRDDGVKDQRAFDALTGVPGRILDNPQANPDQVKKSARFLYGADNYQFIASLPDNQKAAAYASLFSPQRTQSMEKIRDSGDIETYNQYVTSAKMMFGPTFRQAAMSMQQNSVDPSTYRVQYDANTHQFVFDPSLSRFSPRGQPIAVPAHSEIDTINQGLKSLAPVIEGSGQNVEQFLQRQFEESGMTGPPGGWRQSNNAWTQMGGAFFDTKAAVDLQNGASKVGAAPGSTPGNAGGTDPGVRQATLNELGQVQKMLEKTEDPEMKSELGKERDRLLQEYRGMQPQPQGFQPRGNPAPGTPTDEQSSNARDVIDNLTSIPSFVEAVKRGDLSSAALAAATILPFPGGKALKLTEDVAKSLPIERLEQNVVDATTLEARRAAKGLDQANQTTQEISKIDPSKLSDDAIKKVIDTIDSSVGSGKLSREDKIALNTKWGELSDELIKRNHEPYTNAMDKLEEIRQEALTQKISDITSKGGRTTTLTPGDLAAGETYSSKLAKDLQAGLDALPRTNNAMINSSRQHLVERNIISPERLNELIQKQGAKYVIVEKRTNKVVDSATNLKSAARKVDNRDNKYGAYGYTHYKIDE